MGGHLEPIVVFIKGNFIVEAKYHLQISAYAQALWGEVQEEEATLNGFAEATYTASGASSNSLFCYYPTT